MLSTTLERSRASATDGLAIFGALEFDRRSEEAIESWGVREKRDCPLKARLMLGLVVSLALMRELSIPHVFKQMLDWWCPGDGRDPRLSGVTDEALLKAKARLGVDVIEDVFHRMAGKIDTPPSFHGLRVLAVDGTRASLADTKANEKEFGRATSSFGDQVAFPQLSIVALVAADSHHVLDVKVGRGFQDERIACRGFISQLSNRDVVLLDRGFYAAWLARELMAQRVYFVMRVADRVKVTALHRIAHGDYAVLVRGLPAPLGSKATRTKARTSVTNRVDVAMRLIEYRIGRKPLVRLMTNLPEEMCTAREVAQLYSSRWEIELTFDEIKTHLAAPPPGGVRLTFRSKSPLPVLQEVYGLLIAHNLIRSMASLAANQENIQDLVISFTGALRAIRRHAAQFWWSAIRDHAPLLAELLLDIAGEEMARPRRHRVYPRVVRIKMIRTTRKQRYHRGRNVNLAARLRLIDKRYRTGTTR